MQQRVKSLILVIALMLTSVWFTSNKEVKAQGNTCYVPAVGDFVVVGEKVFFVCPLFSGNILCMFPTDCPDE